MTKRQTLTRYVLLAVVCGAGRRRSRRRDRHDVVGSAGWLAARRRLRGARSCPGARSRRTRRCSAGSSTAPAARPVVAITFDDGPSPDTTPSVLDALRAADARATFFVLGQHARASRARRRIGARGTRSQHTVQPLDPDVRLARQITRQLQRTESPARRRRAPPVPRPARLPQPVRDRRRARSATASSAGRRASSTPREPGVDVIVERPARAPARARSCCSTTPTASGDGDRSQTAAAVPAILDATSRRPGCGR